MKKITIALFVAVTLLSGGVKAQVATTIKLSEINPYFDAYLQPFAGAMAVGMGGGWTTTAKTHSFLGFDLTFSGSLVNIPTGDFTFDAEALNMPGMLVQGNGEDPSISASNDLVGPKFGKSVDLGEYGSGDFYFDGLKGLGINKGGNAALQVGFGLPKGTELMVRLVPDFSKSVNNLIGSDDIQLSSTGMWGVGVKHDIKQWIPVVKSVPFLQLSAMLNYSSFKSGFSGDSFLLDPASMGAEDNTGDPSQWENQSLDFTMSSFGGSLLIGANIPIFQPYIGLGFNSASFKGSFNGYYPILTLGADPLEPDKAGAVVYDSEENPLDVDFKATLFNFQAGARIKLGVFILHYTYSIQKYSMHTAGLGFTFR